MSLGRTLKKLTGKKKSRNRRDATLGTLRDPLAGGGPADALTDPLQAPAPTAPPARMPTRPPPSAPAQWGSAAPSGGMATRRKLGSRRKYNDLKARESHYDGEFEKATWRRGEVEQGNRQGFNVKTHKATDEEFNSQYKVGVGTGGMLVGPDGRLLNSEGATSGRGEEGLLTYAMNADGTLGTADADARTTQLSKAHRDWRHLPEDQRGDRPDRTYFHHTSFFGDEEVAAAGEMKVRNGTLKQIDNNTGHFKTRDAQTVQALDELKGRGANIDHANVRLLDHDTIDQTNGRPTSTQVPASAFMSSGGNADAHWAKARMNAQLLGLRKTAKDSDKSIFKNDARTGEAELDALLMATNGLSDEAREAAVRERAAELGVVPDDIDLYFDEVSLATNRGLGAVKTPEKAELDKRAKAGVDQRPIAPRMLAHLPNSNRDAKAAARAAALHPNKPDPAASSYSQYNPFESNYSTAPSNYSTAPSNYSTAPSNYSTASSDYVVQQPETKPAQKSQSTPFQSRPTAPAPTQAPLTAEDDFGFAPFVVDALKAEGEWPPTHDANGTEIGQPTAPAPEAALAPLGPEDNYGFSDFIIPMLKADGDWPPSHDVNGTPIPG